MNWITRRLALGPHPDRKAADKLLAMGITHTLNVGSTRCNYDEPKRFVGTTWHEIVDLQRIPEASVRFCLESLFKTLTEDPGSKVYVHCAAGQNRSPNILWLFLIACGMPARDAELLITERTLDAVPNHRRLVDDELVEYARAHGTTCMRPVPERTLDAAQSSDP